MEQLHLITVVGLKRTGKTTVVEALVSELCSRGHAVGTVKTMRHHQLSLDASAADTRRHMNAGASVVVAITPDGTARFEAGAPPPSLEDVSRLFPPGIRILVSEGAIDTSAPGFVVLCLDDISGMEEVLRTRGIQKDRVAAISGKGAAIAGPSSIPAFDVTDRAQRKALTDLLLTRIAEAESLAEKGG